MPFALSHTFHSLNPFASLHHIGQSEEHARSVHSSLVATEGDRECLRLVLSSITRFLFPLFSLYPGRLASLPYASPREREGDEGEI